MELHVEGQGAGRRAREEGAVWEREFTFVDTCGGSDGAEVAVANDLKQSEELEHKTC